MRADLHVEAYFESYESELTPQERILRAANALLAATLLTGDHDHFDIRRRSSDPYTFRHRYEHGQVDVCSRKHSFTVSGTKAFNFTKPPSLIRFWTTHVDTFQLDEQVGPTDPLLMVKLDRQPNLGNSRLGEVFDFQLVSTEPTITSIISTIWEQNYREPLHGLIKTILQPR